MSGIINMAGSRSGVIGITELDYEEGTWTPTVYGSSTAGTSIVYSTQDATYTKVGRVVHFYARLSTTDLDDMSGAMNIAGFPFAAGVSWGGVTFTRAVALNVTVGANITGWMSSGNSYMQLMTWDDSGGNTTLLPAEWSDDGDVMFYGHYSSA